MTFSISERTKTCGSASQRRSSNFYLDQEIRFASVVVVQEVEDSVLLLLLPECDARELETIASPSWACHLELMKLHANRFRKKTDSRFRTTAVSICHETFSVESS